METKCLVLVLLSARKARLLWPSDGMYADMEYATILTIQDCKKVGCV